MPRCYSSMKYKPVYQPADIREALLGGTIDSVQVRGDGSAYLVISNKVKVGRSTIHKTFTLATQADPEGNGPGFLAVDEVVPQVCDNKRGHNLNGCSCKKVS